MLQSLTARGEKPPPPDTIRVHGKGEKVWECEGVKIVVMWAEMGREREGERK